jgi:hypothetical protein
MRECLHIHFTQLFFLILIFVTYISVSEVEKPFLWAPLNYQGVHSRYRCGARRHYIARIDGFIREVEDVMS